jgi:hypothetical protein
MKRNPKLQIPNKFQISIPNNQKGFVWDFKFWSLEFICNLVLVIWCLFKQHVHRFLNGSDPDQINAFSSLHLLLILLR